MIQRRRLIIALLLSVFLVFVLPSGAVYGAEAVEPGPIDEGESGGGLDEAVECAARPLFCLLQAGSDEVVGGVVGEFAERAETAFDFVVLEFWEAGIELFSGLSTWWVDIPNRVTTESTLIGEIESMFSWIVAAFVMAGFMAAGIRMIWQRGPEPAVDLARAVVSFVLVSGVGVALVQGFAAASDAWAAQLMAESLDLGDVDATLLPLASLNSAMILILALVMIIGGLVQAVLMVAREASLIILTGLIVLAASGQFFRSTQTWLYNLLGWIIPLILWKPIAAILTSLAFRFLAAGDDLLNFVIGLVLLVGAAWVWQPLRSIFSMFNPANANAGYTRSGGGGFSSVAGVGALAISAGARTGVQPDDAAPRSRGNSSGSSGASTATTAGTAGGPAAAAAGTAATIVRSTERTAASAVQPQDNGKG